MIKHLPLLGVFVLLLGGCWNYSPSDEQQSQLNLQTLPPTGFMAQWKTELPGDAIASVQVTDDFIYAYLENNRVVGVRRDTGQRILDTQMARPVDDLFPPIALKDTVVFPTTGELEVYTRLKDRIEFLRKLPLDFSVSSSGIGQGDRVYMGGAMLNGGRVVCLSTEKSPYVTVPKWTTMSSTRGQFSAAPAIFQGFIFAGCRDGEVYGMRVEDRAAIWINHQNQDYGFKTGAPIVADLRADGSGVYVASRDTKVYCLDVNSGAQRWIYYADAILDRDAKPVLDADAYYLFVPGKGLVALSRNNEGPVKNPKWMIAEGVQYLSHDDKLVYLLSKDQRILGVDKAKGEIRMASNPTTFTQWGTNLKDATVFAANDKYLYSIKTIPKPGITGELVLEITPIAPVAAAR